MSEIKLTPWKCQHGHVLGSVRCNGSKITQLLLYRESIDLAFERPSDVDVIAVVEGYVADVRCNVPGCGSVRTWVPGEAALKKLLASHKHLLEKMKHDHPA
jgi:hypothetical protein